MKIVVKPTGERHRTFKRIDSAMRFAEAARFRQVPGGGAVAVWQEYRDKYILVGRYGTLLSPWPPKFAWEWRDE